MSICGVWRGMRAGGPELRGNLGRGQMDRSSQHHRLSARQIAGEISGACGDLGTFIPHVIGAITVAGLAPAGVLFGFGVFLISTGLFYGLPLPVQPMKAISAVILTNGLRPGEVAAAGILIGLV